MYLIRQPWRFCSLYKNVSQTSAMDVLWLTQRCLSHKSHGCCVAYTTMCLIHQPWMLCGFQNNVSHTSVMDALYLTQQCVSYINHRCNVAYTTMCHIHQPWMLCCLLLLLQASYIARTCQSVNKTNRRRGIVAVSKRRAGSRMS